MLSECANPECRADFDYHHGQFFRVRKPPVEEGHPSNTHSVQHFWLCGKCAQAYYLENVKNKGILLRSRIHPSEPAGGPPLIVAT